MPTYVRYDKDNNITASATWAAPGMVEVDFNVVRGYDGKLYQEGKEPIQPQEEITANLFASLRAERDKRLAETDYLIMADYPISEKTLNKVKAYRQALRNLPSGEGAPWDGGKENTPWPEKPEF